MKCYNLTLYIFILMISSSVTFSNEVKGTLSLLKEEKISNGDLVELYLVSDLSLAELKKYEGSFIQDRIYAVEIKPHENQGYIVEAFISNPIQSQKPPKFSFNLNPFKIEFDKNRVVKNYQLFELKWEKPQSLAWLYTIAFLIFGLIISFYLKTRPDRLLRKKIKMKRKEKALELVELVIRAKTREDLEKIYKRKRDISQFLENSDEYNKFIKAIDSVQYKKEWSEEEIVKILSEKRKLPEVRMRNGI